MKQNILDIDTIPNPGIPDYAGYDNEVRDDYVGADMFEGDMPLTPKYDTPDEDNGPNNVDGLIDVVNIGS